MIMVQVPKGRYWKSTLVFFLMNTKVQLLAFMNSLGMIIQFLSEGKGNMLEKNVQEG